MKYNKPLIGVTTSARKATFMWWCTYMAVKLAGGKAIRITALNNKDYTPCSGYIITGGVDIDPGNYNQKNTASVDIEPERDAMEKQVIRYALEKRKPLMGICRGAQMINVVLGGTLHQNARDFYEHFVPSDSLLGKIFFRKSIRITRNGNLRNLLRNKFKISVNSLHHQAIDKLGKHLKVVAVDKHEIVQAIESTHSNSLFILGVQWHPEFMLYSKYQRKLFKALTHSC